jgi:hypothetical protein
MDASQASRCAASEVELLLEPFLRRFSGVDRATLAARCHPPALLLAIAWPVGDAGCEDRRVAGRFGFTPKKSGPDHAVSVIFLAIAESER